MSADGRCLAARAATGCRPADPLRGLPHHYRKEVTNGADGSEREVE